jgi:hypothetical protein
MKKILQLIIVAFASASFLSSCLKHNLPETKDSNQNNIADFIYYYKYADTTVVNAGTPNEQKNVSVRTITLNYTKTISNDTIYVKPTLPAAMPLSIKVKISLTNIWATANIPNAARIDPVGEAPVLGTPGNYSQPVTYKVTAANGSSKNWVIKTTQWPVVSAYEGSYKETGTLIRGAGAPEALNATVYLNTINANTVEAQAGSSIFNNPIILYYIQVNADNTVTILQSPTGVANGITIGPLAPGSSYNPATKTFTLNYGYTTSAARIFSTTLVKQ